MAFALDSMVFFVFCTGDKIEIIPLMYNLKRTIAVRLTPAARHPDGRLRRPLHFSGVQFPSPLLDQVDLLLVVGAPEMALSAKRPVYRLYFSRSPKT